MGMVRGASVNYANYICVFFCRLLYSLDIVCANLIIKYYYAHVSVNFPRLGFNLISPPAALLFDLCQNQSGSATIGPNKLPSI